MLKLDLHDELLDLAEALRPLPATVIELAAAIAGGDVGAAEVASIVETDPALVAGLLREANSAASGSSTEIATIEQAVVRLGVARVLAVATSASLGDVTDRNIPGYDLAGDTLWRHARLVSEVAETIYRSSPSGIGPAVVTAALLHDVGKVVLGQVLDQWQLYRARLHHGELTSAERELIDVDHAEVGAFLLELWNLPRSVTEAVRYHHRPADGPDLNSHVTFAADTIAWLMTDNSEPDELDELERSLELLAVSRDQIVDSTRKRLERNVG